MVPTRADVDSCLDAAVDSCSITAGLPLSIREMGLVHGVRVEGLTKFSHETGVNVRALAGASAGR
jgi:hypothetical protein